MSDALLDAKGLKCPLPVLKARRAMKPLEAGDILTIEATDPGSVEDFEHFCEATGNQMVESLADDGVFTYRIRKAG